MPTIILRHGWLLFIAVTFVNAAVWWKRGQRSIEQRPELGRIPKADSRLSLFFGNIPWIVMGVGIIGGAVPTMFHYFNAKNGSFVIAWYASVVLLWVLTLCGGVQSSIEPAPDPGVRLVCIAGGIVALAMFLFGDLQNTAISAVICVRVPPRRPPPQERKELQ